MKNPTRILGPDGKPIRSASPHGDSRAIRARYDAAQTTAENANHWANADGLSAAAANSPGVRRVLRNRARYERDNNGYCSGIVETLANDTIGTGPRLQLLTDDPDLNARVARDFESWSASVGLAEKLRTLRESRSVDGEAFAVFGFNPGLEAPVRLDLAPIEADQVATPDLFYASPRDAVDGIRFDRYGNPTEYHILKDHPGDTFATNWGNEYDRFPAARVFHWFKARRPGQRRGVPEITPALPLFAQLRRFTLATLSAAEVAALFAVLLKSTLPPGVGDDDEGDGLLPFATQEIVRGMMSALPDGYEADQLKPEHPSTTYPQFKGEVLNEIARPLNVPYNVAAGNSSSYNYASGRLDHQVYHRAIGVDRYQLETSGLDRLLGWWLLAWWAANPDAWPARVDDPDPTRPAPLAPWPHAWYWDGFKHVDPSKEATAQEIRLQNGTATLADEWAEAGFDWREKARQQAEERRFYAELGIPYPGDSRPSPAAEAARRGEDDDGD